MRIAFIDLEAPPRTAAVMSTDAPSFGEAPSRAASPSLLAWAGAARRGGDDVSYHLVAPAALQDAALTERLGSSDSIVVAAASASARTAGEVVAALGQRHPQAKIELFDPWSQPRPQSGMPAYELSPRGVALSEVDVSPLPDPTHPWVVPPVPNVAASESAARVIAATAAAPNQSEAHLYLNDDRVVIDMPRLQFLAETVRASLRDRKVLMHLHLRAWPHQLLSPHLLDHLSLLPVGSLDLLAGSVLDASLGRMESVLTAADLTRCLAEVLRSGLAHLSRLSVVLGLPGESADHVVAVINETFRLAVQHRISRLRFSFWLGPAATTNRPAASVEDEQQRFMAAHPSWHEIEYRGVQDLLALAAMANKQIRVVGPLHA